MKNIDSDLIRGNIDTIILKTLLDGDKYGLDIIKEVENRSNGTYELKQPTLYSCLKRLENQELISSYWLDSDIGGKRHYYKLTDKGHETLEHKQEEWSKSKFIIDNLLSNFDYDEYRLVKKDDYDKIIEEKQFDTTSLDNKENSIVEENNNNQLKEENKHQEELNNQLNEKTQELQDKIANLQKTVEELTANIEEKDEQHEKAKNEVEKQNEEILELNKKLEEKELELKEKEEKEKTLLDSLENNHVYYSNNSTELNQENDSTELIKDEIENQAEKENNLLSRFHSWDNNEINEYSGNRDYYTKNTPKDVVQENMLDLDNSNNNNQIQGKLNEFESAIENLNNFNSSEEYLPIYEDETQDEIQLNEDFEEKSQETTINNIDDSNDFLNELQELNQETRMNYFNSLDDNKYNSVSSNIQLPPSINNQNHDFIDKYEDEENQYNDDIDNNFVSFDLSESNDDNEEDKEDIEENSTYEDFNSIISKNANDYKIENSSVKEPEYQPFKPNYAGANYRQKLSDLSAYSIKKEDEKSCENKNPVKDIETIKQEFEQEGIVVKEFKRSCKDNVEKNYLLSNKIKLVRSSILLFGYIFMLSALYIILANTPFKNTYDFHIKYFLFGFIPFAIYFAYNLIVYLMNPYKKVPARYAPRIMIFISFIMTIQLLLITYCLNLQLGFYSFTQANYNHLLWVIPGIISFAPIISNVIYISLFYSRNFNV